MSIPDFQTAMLPLLKLAAEREWRISDAVDRLADEFKISLEERAALLPSGRQTTIRNRVHGRSRIWLRPGCSNPPREDIFAFQTKDEMF